MRTMIRRQRRCLICALFSPTPDPRYIIADRQSPHLSPGRPPIKRRRPIKGHGQKGHVPLMNVAMSAYETTAPPASSVGLGWFSAPSEDGLRFVQERIALFGKVSFLISLMFFVAGSASECVTTGFHILLTDPSRRWHTIGALITLAVWLWAKRRTTHGARHLAVLDAAGIVLGCGAYILMGWTAHDVQGLHTSLLALFSLTMTRAIVVPSSARRTLLATTMAVIGLPVVTWLALRDPNTTAYQQKLPPLALHIQIIFVLFKTLWCATIVTIATVASKVIYGLQQKVHEARRLGQYTLEEKIGEGGMGQVYRASHAMLRRPTALKLLEPQGISEGQLRRFEREVQMTSVLTHANTISIYDYGRTPDGTFYYAMEYLDGFNLEELVELDGPQSPERVIHLLRQVCGALNEAHSRGLIHRDVKPANIFLCERGGQPDVIKVLDFGLVKEMSNDQDYAVTSVNVITGTPLYLSPEAIRSPNEVTASSDLYALGAVGYYILTGRPVFEGDSVVEICGHHLHSTPKPPSQFASAPVSPEFEAALLSCLAKDPGERPSSAQEFKEQLARCPEAQGWNETNARAWWASRKRRDPNAPGHAEKRSSNVHRTIAVDLQTRVPTVR